MIEHSTITPCLLVIGAVGIGIINFKRNLRQPMTRNRIKALIFLVFCATILVIAGAVYGK